MVIKYQPIGVGMTPSETGLGEFIRNQRLEQNLRQTDLARLAGFSQELLSCFEVGRSEYLDPKQLEGLARALRCDPRELRRLVRVKRAARPRTKLGRFIRARRKEIALTLEEFAIRMETNLQRAKDLEGRHSPSLVNYDTAKRLATALNLEISAFAEFVGVNAKLTDSELGRKVRNRRRELGMSSTQLAQKLGVSRQLISQIELGQCSLNNNVTLEGLAHTLELDVSELRAIRPKRKLAKRGVRKTPLGNLVTKRRLELRYNQSQVAQLASIGLSTISRIETGEYRPGPRILGRLEKALKCAIPTEISKH